MTKVMETDPKEALMSHAHDNLADLLRQRLRII